MASKNSMSSTAKMLLKLNGNNSPSLAVAYSLAAHATNQTHEVERELDATTKELTDLGNLITRLPSKFDGLKSAETDFQRLSGLCIAAKNDLSTIKNEFANVIKTKISSPASFTFQQLKTFSKEIRRLIPLDLYLAGEKKNAQPESALLYKVLTKSADMQKEIRELTNKLSNTANNLGLTALIPEKREQPHR